MSSYFTYNFNNCFKINWTLILTCRLNVKYLIIFLTVVCHLNLRLKLIHFKCTYLQLHHYVLDAMLHIAED